MKIDRVQATVATIQRKIDLDLEHEQAPGADGLGLQEHMESLFLHPENARGTVLMFQGYTAGPWQYQKLAQKFADAGYNVYAPRFPGHGETRPDGIPTGKNIPDVHHVDKWNDFVDETYQEAKDLGAPIYAIGLSGGANVALKMAERHPDLKGVGAMAPYLGADLPRGIPFRLADVLDKLTFGGFGLILDHIPHRHNEKVEHDPTPHTQGSLGQAKVMRHLGQDIQHIGVPVQLISTDGDLLSGKNQDARMFERCGGESQSGWYRFHADEHVPHAMVNAAENKDPVSVQKVEDILFNFVTQGTRAQRH